MFGDVTLAIDDSDGTIEGTSVNVPYQGVDGVTIVGTVSATQITADFILSLTAGGTLTGNYELNKDATNQVPIAVATATSGSSSFEGVLTTVVSIDASLSSDADGDPLTYEWDVADGALTNGSEKTNQTVHLIFPGTEDSTLTLTVNDGRGGLGQVQIIIAASAAQASLSGG